MNSILERQRKTRKWKLQLHVPIIVPISPQVRLIQTDTSYKSIQKIYDEFCCSSKIDKESAAFFYLEKLRLAMGEPEFVSLSLQAGKTCVALVCKG